MALMLRGAGAIVSHGGKTYNFGRGAIPESTPEPVLAILRRRGAIVGEVPTILGLAATAPENQPGNDGGGSHTNPPGPTIDVATASVEEIARHIEAGNDGKGLTVPQTVALAEGGHGEKVLEAEALASGGDPRQGVTDKLT